MSRFMLRFSVRIAIGGSSLGLLNLAACRSPDAAGPTEGPAGPVATTARADRYIVVVGPNAGDVSGSARVIMAGRQGRLGFVYQTALHGFAAELTPAEAAALAKDPRVERVEADQVVEAFGTLRPVPSWGLDRLDQRALPLGGGYTWNATGSGVHVYIIDTGILLTHAQFAGRAKFAFDAIGDGFGQTDCHGHGTHVAATAGGSTMGVAHAVALHSVRVLDCGGFGLTSQVIAGIDWVTAHAVKPAVANMSLGGGAQPALDQAVANSIKAGITYVIAAGNSNRDACAVSPARAPAAITVAASDIDDARATFSNWGTCVDLFGPGVNITSAWKTGNTATKVLSGTSMATPHVTGAAALYLETRKTATPADVAYGLLTTATAGVIKSPGTGSPNRLVYGSLFSTASSNLPPLADFDFSCTSLGCSFDGRVSKDDQGIASASWAFGDGTAGTGLTPSNTYGTGKTYTATLTVTDAGGLKSSLAKSFTLPAKGGRAGLPPKADFFGYPHGGTVDFDASLSTDDVGIGSYQWDFGDGKKGTGKTIVHQYSAPNQFYDVTLTVYDLAGQSATRTYQFYPNSQ